MPPLSAPPADAAPPPGGGGGSRTDKGAATNQPPSTANLSPSQAAPSLPGGGGKTLQDCMGFWDKATHMSKQQWRAACQRTLNRIENLKVEADAAGLKLKQADGQKRPRQVEGQKPKVR
jgi:hypothetical protein